ncbi:MAG: hypothetical protein Q6373_017430 [Candidatus Sigynarchaeota archaeon]
MMRLDESGASITNKLVFIQSVEAILESAGKHPGLDIVALEKARNAARRSLAEEIRVYKKGGDRGQYTATECCPVPLELKFKPLA